ncbi:hypothetical protein l11_05870 [Neisseria weaveri LMG 5135]|nr:hypothetical protein l11_05870 [Neisseria weaveri LMG 5135]
MFMLPGGRNGTARVAKALDFRRAKALRCNVKFVLGIFFFVNLY